MADEKAVEVRSGADTSGHPPSQELASGSRSIGDLRRHARGKEGTLPPWRHRRFRLPDDGTWTPSILWLATFFCLRRGRGHCNARELCRSSSRRNSDCCSASFMSPISRGWWRTACTAPAEGCATRISWKSAIRTSSRSAPRAAFPFRPTDCSRTMSRSISPQNRSCFTILRPDIIGIVRRQSKEIVILVASCQSLADNGVTVLFTDRHAYAATAAWSADRDGLAATIDWDILCRHDFGSSDSYPDKKERYQAEAFAHRHVPPVALLAVGCVSEEARREVEDVIQRARSTLRVVVRPGWYFL